jgi:hypothetical protein
MTVFSEKTKAKVDFNELLNKLNFVLFSETTSAQKKEKALLNLKEELSFSDNLIFF